jgi:hypothetical protein
MGRMRAPSLWESNASGFVARARGGTWKVIDILACPVTFSPHPPQIDAARRGYGDWWSALGWVRVGLITGGMLPEVEVTGAMPRLRPWLARTVMSL